MGFSWNFVRSFVLPEWWEDSMAQNAVNRALAEAYIAKQLGISAEALRRRDQRLEALSMSEVRFKRYKNQVDETVYPTVIVALRAAQIVVQALREDTPKFQGPTEAHEIRNAILRQSEYADLDSLLEYCWQAGIIVLQLESKPAGSKGFDGLAAIVEGRPVIILASARDSAPWLAFYVAHELGHIMLEHVQHGSGALIDKSLKSATGQDDDESQADRFALEVLAGHEAPKLRNLRVKAEQLAVIAARNSRHLGVDPGVYALIYAKSNNRWPVAQKALKVLGLDCGGKTSVASLLSRFVDWDRLSEADEQFIGVLQQP